MYVDISVINWALPREEFHSYLRRLVESGFGKRILFGSDQMVWPEAIGLAIEGVDSAPFLTEDEKRDIFHDNAVRFFRLDERKPPSTPLPVYSRRLDLAPGAVGETEFCSQPCPSQ